MCYLIGETLPHSEFVNGVRFVDKTKTNKIKNIVFKFEVWANSSLEPKELDELKEFLSKDFGCPSVDIRKIS